MRISKEIIEELYINQLKPAYIVCKELGIPSSALDSYLYEYGIPKRSQSEAALLAYKKKRGVLSHGSRMPLKTIPKDRLKLYYVDQEMGMMQVSKQLKCDVKVVKRELKRYRLLRSQSEQAQITGKHLRENCKVKRKKINMSGYFYVYNPNHPRSNQMNYICEHIVVWEQYHGQSLPEDWVVHHLNGDKHDNRIENLIGLSKGKHHHHLLSNALNNRIRDLERMLENKLSGIKFVPQQYYSKPVKLEQQQFAFMS